jgi:DNA-binding transcriptional regulator YhcF (GntR family)
MDAAAALRDSLFENLRSRTWRPGHRIPAERALGEEFGLGRSTVRRVLQEFKRLGLITQTVGSGTFVAEQVQQLLSALAPAATALSTSPAELMSARLVLEPALIELVIGRLQHTRRSRYHARGLRTLGRPVARGHCRSRAQRVHYRRFSSHECGAVPSRMGCAETPQRHTRAAAGIPA